MGGGGAGVANLADPGRHGVRARRAVVRVDDNNGDDDGGDDEDHGEEHVFPDQRNGAGGGRDQLHDNQQEDGQRQQDGDGQSHLLACGGGQRKDVLHLREPPQVLREHARLRPH